MRNGLVLQLFYAQKEQFNRNGLARFTYETNTHLFHSLYSFPAQEQGAVG